MSYRCSLPSSLQKRSKDYIGLHRSSAKFLRLWREVSEKAEKLLAKVKENSEAQNLQKFYAILCNPWISSAMAMAKSIYRTLCVLVIFKFETSQQQPRMFFISRPLMQLVINYQMFCNTSKLFFLSK